MVVAGNGFYRQLTAGSAACLGVLASAVIMGWVTPILPALLGPHSEIPMTDEQASWMVSMPEIGNLFSPLPAGYMADRFGRKTTILTSAPLFMLGWGIIICFRNILALNVGRLIKGLAQGIVFTVVPIYLGEIASPECRGAVTSLFFLSYWLGFLLEYILGPFLSYTNFTLVSASSSIIFFLAFFWQPDSHYYYLMINDMKKAKKSLSWLSNSDDETVHETLESMRRSIEEEKKEEVKWNELIANPVDRKALAILIFSGYIRICCGILPLSIYSTEILKVTEGDAFISPDNVTLIMGLMMVVGCLGGFFMIDRFGRRPLFFYSCTISGISMFCAGTFFVFQSTLSDYFSWVPAVSMIVLSAVSLLGIYPISTAYASELFTSNTRAKASGVNGLFVTILAVIICKYYVTVFDNFGVSVSFFFFASNCFLGSFLSYFVMPETKGKTFEQIRKDLL